MRQLVRLSFSLAAALLGAGCVDLEVPLTPVDARMATTDARADVSVSGPDAAPDVPVVDEPDAADPADVADAETDVRTVADAGSVEAAPPKPDAPAPVDAAANYVCNDAGCPSSCTSSAQCRMGLVCGGGACGGLKAEIFGDEAMQDRRGVRIDPKIDFEIGRGSPEGASSVKDFTIRWTGSIIAAHSETYTFFADVDDGARLWIDGVLVLGQWPSASGVLTGTFAMRAGVPHTFKMDYVDVSLSAHAHLSWSSPSQPKQIVPTSAFLPAP